MVMTSSRPYLIRAIYEWIVDNEMTPYIVVNAEYEGVQIPRQYVEEGKIILNISPEACRGLHLENDRIVFTAKFAGDAIQIYLPPEAVMALYSKENGKGMVFNDEENGTDDADADFDTFPNSPESKSSSRKNKGKPNLKLIKGN